jgi:O-antigen ligase
MLTFLVVLAFVNDGLFRVREPGDIGLDWQNAMKLALWAGAFAIGVCRLPRSYQILCGPTYLWVFVYISYALTSCIFSASPGYSFGTAMGLVGMPLFGAALAVTAGEKPILVAFMLSLLVFLVLGWGAYFAVPELGRSLFITSRGTVVERICGLAGQANALGNVLAVFLAVLFLLWLRGHLSIWICTPLAAFGVMTLLAADSRTALLALLIGIAAITVRRSVWLWGTSSLAGIGILLIGMSIPLRDLLGLTSGLSRSGDPTELFTLTGRTEIWEYAWTKIVLNPWVGYGYNASKFILPDFDGLPGLKIDEAHNMLLQNLLAVGIIGTIPLGGFLLQQLVDFVRHPDSRRDLLVFMTLIWGITVAGPFGSTPTVMTLSIFILLPFSRLAAVAGAAPADLTPLLPAIGKFARASPIPVTMPSVVP